MENSISPKESPGRKIIIIVSSVFFLFVIYYSVMALLSQERKISEINSEFAFKPPENTAIDNKIFSDSAFVKLYRDNAFYKARIAMAETDSISLSLNLSDSTAALEINGVTVHAAKISSISLSKVFSKADEYAVTSMLSAPFTVNRDFSSIRKEPVMLKIAPKDTSEYKPDILPDTSNRAAVNYILEMDNGFRLYVYESGEDDPGSRFERFLFDIADRFRNSIRITGSILSFRIPEYHPAIKIRLPKTDARIIYRGLPRKGQVALYR